MNRRQFFAASVAATILPTVAVAKTAKAAPHPLTQHRQYARVFCISLSKPMNGRVDRLDVPCQILICTHNKTDDFGIETDYRWENDGFDTTVSRRVLNEYLVVRRSDTVQYPLNRELLRFPIDTIKCQGSYNGVKFDSISTNDVFIAIGSCAGLVTGGTNEPHWKRIKEQNPWMHPEMNPGFKVAEDNYFESIIITWTNPNG